MAAVDRGHGLVYQGHQGLGLGAVGGRQAAVGSGGAHGGAQGREAVVLGQASGETAGGLVGAAELACRAGFPKVLTFDMGGTSTDVARIDGPFTWRQEQEIGSARVFAPALKIETVAAGGGSICRWRNGRLEVGPESAGANPGPKCYRRGGPLAVTDANVMVGKLLPDFFPKIFGPHQNEPLDDKSVREAFEKLAGEVGDGRKPEEVADGFIVHPFGTEQSLRELTIPAVARGAEQAGRALADVEIAFPLMAIIGDTDEQLEKGRGAMRPRLAFYGSTPAYKVILDVHGWGDLQPELNRLSKAGDWATMSSLISDEMVDAFCVQGNPDEIGPIAASLWIGIAFAVVGVVMAAIAMRKRTPAPSAVETPVSSLSKPLLDAGQEIGAAASRNPLTFVLAAFVAGLLLSRRGR